MSDKKNQWHIKYFASLSSGRDAIAIIAMFCVLIRFIEPNIGIAPAKIIDAGERGEVVLLVVDILEGKKLFSKSN